MGERVLIVCFSYYRRHERTSRHQRFRRGDRSKESSLPEQTAHGISYIHRQNHAAIREHQRKKTENATISQGHMNTSGGTSSPPPPSSRRLAFITRLRVSFHPVWHNPSSSLRRPRALPLLLLTDSSCRSGAFWMVPQIYPIALVTCHPTH